MVRFANISAITALNHDDRVLRSESTCMASAP